MKLKKKIIPIICALGLMAAYPAMSLEKKVDSDYKDVKKLKITRSTIQWFNDYGVKTETKRMEVEKTYKDGRILTEHDTSVCGVLDGEVDYTVMRYEKVYDKNGYKTVVIEEDRGYDGTIDYRETHKFGEQLFGAHIIEKDFGADGKIDVIITEMLCSGNVTIKEYDGGADGVIEYREKKTYMPYGVVVTEHDLFADGFIDAVETEKVLKNGDSIVETRVYGLDGSESLYRLTKKTLPDGTKVEEFDANNDGIPDYRERETVTKYLGGGYTKVHEVEEKADGNVQYRSIEDVLEVDMP